MVGVDLIGEIRRAYFEQRRPIKEIVRTLAVSRATVRRVIRSQKTEFKYERGVQPAPKLGEWVAVLTEILEQEAKLFRAPEGVRERSRPRPLGRGATPSGHEGVRGACAISRQAVYSCITTEAQWETHCMSITKARARPDASEAFMAKAPDAVPKRWQRGHKTQVTLSISPDLLNQVDEVAQRKHLSRAALLTVWINDRLEQEQRRE
jgi:hypothetical protein